MTSPSRNFCFRYARETQEARKQRPPALSEPDAHIQFIMPAFGPSDLLQAEINQWLWPSLHLIVLMLGIVGVGFGALSFSFLFSFSFILFFSSFCLFLFYYCFLFLEHGNETLLKGVGNRGSFG